MIPGHVSVTSILKVPITHHTSKRGWRLEAPHARAHCDTRLPGRGSPGRQARGTPLPDHHPRGRFPTWLGVSHTSPQLHLSRRPTRRSALRILHTPSPPPDLAQHPRAPPTPRAPGAARTPLCTLGFRVSSGNRQPPEPGHAGVLPRAGLARVRSGSCAQQLRGKEPEEERRDP